MSSYDLETQGAVPAGAVTSPKPAGIAGAAGGSPPLERDHYFHAGLVERWRRHKGRCLTGNRLETRDGYSRATRAGGEVPWLTKREAQAASKKAGARAIFYDSEPEARAALLVDLAAYDRKLAGVARIQDAMGPLDVTFGVGARVKVDAWRWGGVLVESDWDKAPYRLRWDMDRPELAVRVEITGSKVRWERSLPFNGGCLRVKVTFVGDGEPDEVCYGFIAWADCTSKIPDDHPALKALEEKSPVSYKAVCYDRSGPGQNALRFATAEEAEAYAKNLYSRWTAMTKYEIKGCDDPVNYRWTDEGLESV
jgi:hypothetical protein